MASASAFEPGDTDEVAALWRSLHPDWTWLDDREYLPLFFERQDNAFEQIRYVVRCRKDVIATVFARCSRQSNWPPCRTINIETRPENIAAEWLDPILASFVDSDRGRPDMWHVTSLPMALSPHAAPLLEASGFVRHSSQMIMEWSGEAVMVVDPSPARLQRYAGGDRETDRAIVDLHNRSYRQWRLVPPADIESLWQSWPGLEAHEFVLALENDRLVGYSTWVVTAGEPWISDHAAARSHWGTGVASAVGTKAMQILLERGYRLIKAAVRSTNAPALRLHRKFGWRVGHECAQTFVRKL
jgi:GNAT superfamily N-acetyltransferase